MDNSNQYQLTTWFYIYRGLIIPSIVIDLFLAFSMVLIGLSGTYSENPLLPFLFLCLSFVDAVMLIILYMGLYQRKLWVWKLNFFVLILTTTVGIINVVDRIMISGGSAGVGFIWGLIIFGSYGYFNWDYFTKRKHLFFGDDMPILEDNFSHKTQEFKNFLTGHGDKVDNIKKSHNQTSRNQPDDDQDFDEE